MTILHIVLWIIFCYLAFCVLYNFIFAVSGRLVKSRKYLSYTHKNRFAILIPTYKDDNIILNTVQNILDQDYPNDKYDLIVIADQLKPLTLMQLKLMPIRLIQVSFKNSTKAKSLKFALELLPEDYYDSILILDSDNLLGKGSLEKANHALNSGFKMVQLHRTAKNKNTATAILDAISEEIGNAIHRRGHRALGLSATLIGSGMAFDYMLFKSVIMDLDIEDNPAEDREINAEMLQRGYTCEYIEDALVFDEKVASKAILERQRTRWISAQLNYIRRFWFINPIQTLATNANYFDYALQTLILPRSILIVLTFALELISVLFLFLNKQFYPGALLWICLFILIACSLTISIGKSVSKSEFKIAVFYFPSTFLAFMKAFVKSSSKQREFIHTPKEFIK